ncbi:hypothetical protein RUND412_000401 [Rhizina undulata]
MRSATNCNLATCKEVETIAIQGGQQQRKREQEEEARDGNMTLTTKKDHCNRLSQGSDEASDQARKVNDNKRMPLAV